MVRYSITDNNSNSNDDDDDDDDDDCNDGSNNSNNNNDDNNAINNDDDDSNNTELYQMYNGFQWNQSLWLFCGMFVPPHCIKVHCLQHNSYVINSYKCHL